MHRCPLKVPFSLEYHLIRVHTISCTDRKVTLALTSSREDGSERNNAAEATAKSGRLRLLHTECSMRKLLVYLVK